MSDTMLATADLDDRIAAAFGDGAQSSKVADLIKEAEAAAVDADKTAERARRRALDPVLSRGEVAAARSAAEDGAFRRERLETAVAKLCERLVELRAQEENQRRQLAYDKAKAERDALAEELARIYPPLAEQLTNLLARIEANDRDVEFINAHALPSGAECLLVAELIARGLEGFVQNAVDIPRVTKHLRLPAFQHSVHEPYAWSRR